jgi:3-oxoacyl-[acyl-carrier protein] reductase
MHLDLSGKTALVTGGSRGLGKAVARRLAGSGAQVAILARDPATLAAATEEIEVAGGRRALGFTCDLAIAEEVERQVQRVLAEFGRIDILVNNAGSSYRRPFLELTRTDLGADMDLKLFAAVRIAQLVVPGMQGQRWGRIITSSASMVRRRRRPARRRRSPALPA